MKIKERFEGSTKEMNGHVFQMLSEQKEKNQFNDALDELETFASTKCVKQIDYLTPLFAELTLPTVPKPVLLAAKKIKVKLEDGSVKEIDDAEPFEVESFRCKVKSYSKETLTLKATLRSLFIVVLGQCSKMMKTKLQGHSNYKRVEKDGDVAELLKMIRAISREMNANESIYDALDEAKRKYYLYRQAPEDDSEQHSRAFKENVDVVEHLGGGMFSDKSLIDYEKQKDVDAGISAKSDAQYKEVVKEKAMGTALIKRADQGRYKELLLNIRDQQGNGLDVYPNTLAAAHNKLEDFARSRNIRPTPRKKSSNRKPGNKNITGLMYNQGELVAGTNGKVFKSVCIVRKLHSST